MKKIYLWLGKLKNTPKVWDVCLPLLAVLAGHVAHYWWIPLLAILVAPLVVPEDEARNAQRIHFLIGFVFTSLFGWWGLLWITVAAILEFWFDPKYEPDAIWPGGVWDFGSYCVGVVMGLI